MKEIGINQRALDVPGLFDLPFARSRWGLPEEYVLARATFAAAEMDYHSGKADQAAAGCLEVARLVKSPKVETTYSEQFAKMREAAYRDAALAFAQAHDQGGAKKALRAALKADPENKETLEKLLAKL